MLELIRSANCFPTLAASAGPPIGTIMRVSLFSVNAPSLRSSFSGCGTIATVASAAEPTSENIPRTTPQAPMGGPADAADVGKQLADRTVGLKVSSSKSAAPVRNAILLLAKRKATAHPWAVSKVIKLEVTPESVVIAASGGPRPFLRHADAAATLAAAGFQPQQGRGDAVVPAVRIEDQPRFAWARG